MKTQIDEPTSPFAQLILAHGAGNDKDSEFMGRIALALCERGVKVLRFDFPYMIKAREKQKRQPPNRMPVLIQDFEEMVKTADTQLPLFIGGKSMGGRVATMLSNNADVRGIVCLGYPFHPPGKPEKLRTEHLRDMATPTLIVQGERDTFGNKDQVDDYVLASTINTRFLKAADHSFVPLKASVLTVEQHIQSAADITVEFMQGLL